MRAYRIALALAISLPVAFGMQRAVSWAMSPPAPPVVRTPAKSIRPLSNDLDAVYRVYRRSRELAPADVMRLTARVARDPGDAPTRALLLAYSMFDRGDDARKRLHNEQAVWFAANLPASPILSSGYVEVDHVMNVRTYELMDRLYDEALQRDPKSPDIMANQAALLLIPEKDRAIALYARAARLDPKSPTRYERLAFAHALASHGLFGRRDRAEATLALESYEKARALGGDFNPSQTVEVAFDAGRLDVVEREAKSSLASGDADAIHAAHTALGRVALRHGDLAAAKTHLLDSAKVEGSPVLGSFGPSMDLAKELLAKGERLTVLAYLEATRAFWPDERQARWTKALQDGGTPDWD